MAPCTLRRRPSARVCLVCDGGGLCEQCVECADAGDAEGVAGGDDDVDSELEFGGGAYG